MEWFSELFTGESIAGAILSVSLVISIGLLCNRIKFGKISLGSTWILFAGIALANFGLGINTEIAEFLKNFGLVIFVYSIGLQVGPSFFASFRKGGIRLNLLAAGEVVLGTVLTVLFAWISGEKLTVMTGVLSGAVTNTPALGAAQQILSEVEPDIVSTLAMGYAVAYPLGVLAVILAFILLRAFFKMDIEGEEKLLKEAENAEKPSLLNVRVTNEALWGKSCEEIMQLVRCRFVIARIKRAGGEVIPADKDIVLGKGDALRIVCSKDEEPALIAFFGEQVHISAAYWENTVNSLVTKRIVVSKNEMQGRKIGALQLRSHYDVNVTRISRTGIDLMPTADFALQIGDRVTVVGRADDCSKVADLLGNSVKKLDVPHIFPIFLGIFLGIILGSIPIYIPSMPFPVKLGLAGGPLIVAILMGRYGPEYKMVTFTTTSANLIMREIGISLFLACVGLLAGKDFVSTITSGGYAWIGWGALITALPVLIMAVIMRLCLKMDWTVIMGCISGAHTNPIALSYANSLSSSDRSSVAYTTVYPLMMFLRILLAEVLVMLAI